MNQIRCDTFKSGVDYANSAPRCGAKSKRNNHAPCKAPAMKNGRCYMHGGTNPGAPRGKKHGCFINGKFSKAVKESKTDFYDFVKTLDAL
jgi:hypothetical protein